MGASPYNNRENLLLEKKTGERKREVPEFIVNQGHKFEAKMRPIAEMILNSNFPSACLEHKQFDFISASLDGFDQNQNIIWECKLVGKKVYDEIVKTGKPPEKYKYQIQQQLLISGARYCVLWYGTDDTTYNHIIVYPETELQTELLKEAKLFYEDWHSEEDIAPPQFDQFLVNYMASKQRFDKAKKEFDAYKEKLKSYDYNRSHKFNDIFYEKQIGKTSSFDKAKLKEDIGDISKYEVKGQKVTYKVSQKEK